VAYIVLTWDHLFVHTQGAIFRLFAPILLFSHLCLYLLYIVLCVHSLSHYSHFLQFCSLLWYQKITDFTLDLQSTSDLCICVLPFTLFVSITVFEKGTRHPEC